MTVIVTHSDTSKSGKPRVYFDGNNNWKDAYYLGPKCPDPPKGVPLEVQTHSWRPENGKSDMWFLDAFKPVEGGVAPPSTQPAPVQQPKASVAPAGYTEPERMFVSNIVAAAVTAGHAKDPVDLLAWASGALVALRQMTNQSTVDKDVGF
jgi:hypothetical protein